MDFSKVGEINISLSTDYANDQAIVRLLPGYSPWKFLEGVKLEIDDEPFKSYLASRGIDFSEPLFEGLVLEIIESDTFTKVLIAAPSSILTRNEVAESFEEETSIEDIIETVAPGFQVAANKNWLPGWRTYYDSSSAGKTVMELLKDIADSLDTKVYVKGWTIYFRDELSENEGGVVYLDSNWVSKGNEKQTGGAEAYTKVVARAYVAETEDVEEEEAILIPDAVTDLIDFIKPEDDVEDYDDLIAILNERVREIKERIATRKFVMPFDPRIKPLTKLIYDGEEYIAREVEHRLTPREWITEVTAYAITD